MASSNLFRIENRDARRLWLAAQGLSSAPTGPLDTLSIIRQLGFVQLDTIRVVSRAHHHILWNRNQHYREPILNELLAGQRQLFEHFTHDASVLPMEFYPMWQRQFTRMKRRIDRNGYYASMPDEDGRAAIRQRIAQEGPLSTHAFDTRVEGQKGMWVRPPHKLALDYMWYCGELATSHRENFKKFYDLSHQVIPPQFRGANHTDETQINWLCEAALQRLGFGTSGEIQRFWDATDAAEVRHWATQNSSELLQVELQAADGSWSTALALPDIENRLAAAPAPTSRLRILNPFDPVIRDRARLKRLFGFDYRIEIFVPAASRKWGYYVFPLLEGDRFVGRIEARADRAKGQLTVLNLWSEPKTRWTAARAAKLDAELSRFARFVALDEINWQCARQPG
uniref:winged helix-turn-helix domain-containing protein n=1 Tax=Pararhizobium sp. IMCC3301 TaxID=3067904 RepID=UPI002741FEB8|nr:crosslink repair DNA glycosylase YcaQ family protein [Pararhizobium sp. IMCC3301]